jgi:hypothetical protein
VIVLTPRLGVAGKIRSATCCLLGLLAINIGPVASQGSSEKVLRPMQHIVFLVVVIVGLLSVDTFSFHNHYRNAAWAEAKYQGQTFQIGIERWLRKNLPF